jgi:general secretion pathway protein E
VDMGVEPFLVPPTLNLALAQRLTRVLCSDCKKKVKAGAEIRELVEKEVEGMPPQIKAKIKIPNPLYLYEPKGCKKCNHTGYSSRMGIFEVLSMTRDLGQLILKNLSEGAIEDESKKQGRISMRQDGIIKVLEGKTTIEEVLRVTK